MDNKRKDKKKNNENLFRSLSPQTHSMEMVLEILEPLVQSRVNKFYENYRMNMATIDREDLEQEARLAVVTAYSTYNPKYEVGLSTWAYHMINGRLSDYRRKNVSSLSGGQYLISMVLKAGENILTCTPEKLMELGVSKKTAQAITYFKHGYDASGYSIDCNIPGDGGIGKDFVLSLDMKKHINELLNEDESFAVQSYYGFNGERMTMQDIGRALGKSRKSVSYLIGKALVKLRREDGMAAYANY